MSKKKIQQQLFSLDVKLWTNCMYKNILVLKQKQEIYIYLKLVFKHVLYKFLIKFEMKYQ